MYLLLAGAVVIIIALIVKVVLLRRAFGEITDQIKERVDGKTNTPITLSTGDKAACKAADTINKEINSINSERIRYETANREINMAVTNISHDLRTPLTAMNSYIDLLMDEKDEEARAEYLRRLKNRADVMVGLTGELFSYSVATTGGEPEKADNESDTICDIRAVLEDCLLSFYVPFTEKGITPEIELPETQVNSKIDKRIAGRIFENIIGNALKYAQKSFIVKMDANGKVVFSNYAPDLTQVDIARLFDRFYTVKNSTASTGLGLSIAKELVHSSGGNITAELSEDKMFSIIIELKTIKIAP